MEETGNFRNIRMVDLLVEYGYVNEEQIRKALEYQREHQKLGLIRILIEMNYITEIQMLKILAAQCHLHLADVAELSVDMEAVGKIPPEIAQRYQVLGIGIQKDTLTLLTNDPLDFYTLEDVRQITGMDLQLVLCESQPLEKAIHYYYSDIQARMAVNRANDSRKEEIEELQIEEGEDDTPIINLLNRLIQRAYHNQASDIHLEPFEHKTVVRMRIDGIMVDFVTLQKSLHNLIIARIKILGDMDIAEHRLPQDGHFRMRMDTEELNMRISIMPTVFGEKAVVRLLTDHIEGNQLRQFGMSKRDYDVMIAMLRSHHGMIYLTGPTGSGKTTTLYWILQELSKRPVNICTIEDPVERNLPGLNQCQVNHTAGMNFENGLRAILRQDPDIIMVGETRDAQTASISIKAAITGHLVLSTLHTNDAVSAIVRLKDMGLKSYLIGNGLIGVVAQRLMRKVCPDCAVLVEADEESEAYLGVKDCKIMQVVGCPRCRNTGYKGRFAIHEIFLVDKRVRHMIDAQASLDTMKEYAVKEQGMRTLRQAGIKRVLDGWTTMEELYQVAYYE